jgi:hypothetical protein
MPTDVVCPTCNTVSRLVSDDRDANSFCPTCDFPLFWARATSFGSGAGNLDGSLHRLPGTAGRITVGRIICPLQTCKEPNLVSAHYCIRCGTDLHPRPVAPVTVEQPAPPPVLVLEAVPPPERDWLPWIMGAIFLLVCGLVSLLGELLH